MHNREKKSRLGASVSRLALTGAVAVLTAYGAITLTGVSAQPVSQGLDRGSTATLPNGAPFSFASLVETVIPAVVSIKVERQILVRDRRRNFRFGPDFFFDDRTPNHPRGRRQSTRGDIGADRSD